MIKVSFIVLVGLVATSLLRGRSASLRHWILAWALVCAALTPALEQIVPAWHAPVNLPWVQQQRDSSTFGGQEPATEIAGAGAHSRTTGPGRQAGVAVRLLELMWAIGAVISLLVLAVGFGRLRRIASRSRQLTAGTWFEALTELDGLGRGRTKVRLLQSDHASLLVTWGFRQPTVVLPRTAREWPAERIRAVLAHELAHVRRADWTVQMVAELLRCVYWFNPLMWIASRRLRRDSELACDDAVLASGMAAPEYAAHLLDVARAFRPAPRGSLLPGMAMVRPSQFERRVHAMLNAKINHSPLTRSACTAAILGLLALTVPIAGMSAVSEASNDAVLRPGVDATTRTVSADAVLTNVRDAAARPVPAPRDSHMVPPSSPQTPASFSGSVVDTTGLGIPDIPVSVTSAASGQRYEARTDEAGRFAIGGLEPGEYQIEVQKPGFKRILASIKVTSGQAASMNVVAQIGMLKETIVVSAASRTRIPAPENPRPMVAVGTPPRDPCEGSTAGGCITPPRKLVDARPFYPPAHADNGVSGTVEVDAKLGTDGFLKDLQPKEGSDPLFAVATLEALRQWQFSPVKLNGVLQECQVLVEVKFTAERK